MSESATLESLPVLAEPRRRGRPRKHPLPDAKAPPTPKAGDLAAAVKAAIPPPSWLASLGGEAAAVREVPVADLKIHPACEDAPQFARSFDRVRRSVADHGVFYPLAVANGGTEVIDGRYRLRAAVELGRATVPVLTVSVDPTDHRAVAAWAYESKDGREHLSEAERAVLAVELQKTLMAKHTKARAKAAATARAAKRAGSPVVAATRTSGKKLDSRKEACEAKKVSERTFRAVARLERDRPDLFEQVRAGTLDVAAAIKQQGKNGVLKRVEAALATVVRSEDIGDAKVENRIHVGDAAEVLRTKVADGVASLVLFSPPYPGVKNDEYEPPLPVVSYAQYLAEMRPVLEQSLRVSRRGGRLAIVVDNTRNRDPSVGDVLLPVAQDLTRLAQEVGWRYWNDVAWCKDQMAGNGTTFGSLGLCSAPFLARSHEWILILCKETHLLEGDAAMCDLTRAEHRAWLQTEWRVPGEARVAIRDHHPAPFPDELPRRLIKLLTYRRDLVIDPMCGSGTTTAVAASLERRWIGIERSPKYAAFAGDRTMGASSKVADELPERPTGVVLAASAADAA